MTSKLLAPMIKHLSQIMAEALAKSPVDKKTAKQVEKVLRNPKRLERDLVALEKIQKGEMSPVPEGELIPGKEIADTMEQNELSNQIVNGGKGWDPETIKHVRENDFRESEEKIQDLIDYDPELKAYIKTNPVDNQTNQGPTPIEPIILGADGLVKDGYKRINAMAKAGLNDAKIKVLAGESSNFPSVALSANADDVVLERIGGFANNLKELVDYSTNTKMVSTNTTKVSGTYPPIERTGAANILKVATTLENGESVLDEPLMTGIAVDILKVLKDNTGGREGGQVFKQGDQQYLAPKNMNKLQEEIGNAVERRIQNKIENTKGSSKQDLKRTMIGTDKSALASGLITMARGNFGQNRNPIRNRMTDDIVYKPIDIPLMGISENNILRRPSLISEKPVYTKNDKGVTKREVMLTTSDFYNDWYRTPSVKRNIKGSNGKRWIDLFEGPIDPTLPAVRPHGKWRVVDGKIVETPLGLLPEDFLAGRDKSKYSLSMFDPEVLNILNKTAVGVDKELYTGWKYLSGEGFFRDSGMTNVEFNAALEKSGLEDHEMGLVMNYFKDVASAKAKHIARENAERLKEGKPALTRVEEVNAFKTGKVNKVRKEITKAYKEASADAKMGTKGGKIDEIIQDLLDIYGGQKVSREVQQSQRSVRKRLIKEIERRFALQDDAEVHTLFKFDYRGRVYSIDPSGANVQTGGFVRHMFRFPKELGVDITYGDASFLRIVDDLILFEDFPIAGAKIGKSEVSGLERYAYFKKNENEYLRRAKELLDVFEKGRDDKEVLRQYKNKANWLRNRGDAGPYMSALLEIGRIRRAYDTPPGKRQEEMFAPSIIPGEKELNVFPTRGPAWDSTKVGITPKTKYDKVKTGVNEKGEDKFREYPVDFSSEQAPRQSYRSTFALEFDAPQSGSQHILAQYGDVATMFKVSIFTEREGVKRLLTPDELADLHAGVPPESKAPDLYADIAVDYDNFWAEYLKDLRVSNPSQAEGFENATKTFMKSGRGVTKPIVMKIPYGAGFKGLKDGLFEQLTSRNRLEMKELGINPTDFMDGHWAAMESALRKGLKTQFEFREWMRAYGKIYENAPMDYGVVRKPLLVKSPFGGVSDFTIYATTIEQLRGKINPKRTPDIKTKGSYRTGSKGKGKTRTRLEFEDVQYYNTETTALGPDDVKSREAYQKAIDKGKAPEDLGLLAVDNKMLKEGPFGVDDQKNMYGALAPNATHNMDAGFLQKLVIEADKIGIPVMVVHDAFFIRPTDIDVFRQLAGKTFKDMHNNYNLRKEMIDSLSEATGIPVETIIKRIEAYLAEKMPDPTTDAIEGFRSGYFNAMGDKMDRSSPKSIGLTAEQGGPIENIGFDDLFSPKVDDIKGRVSTRGDEVSMENVIRGG